MGHLYSFTHLLDFQDEEGAKSTACNQVCNRIVLNHQYYTVHTQSLSDHKVPEESSPRGITPLARDLENVSLLHAEDPKLTTKDELQSVATDDKSVIRKTDVHR